MFFKILQLNKVLFGHNSAQNQIGIKIWAIADADYDKCQVKPRFNV